MPHMGGDSIRWGILGVAKINERLIPSFHAARNGQLSAIASRSIDKATAACKAFSIPRAFGSYEELLADDEIDAVYTPLPNSLHAEWTMKAADQGKHILCEKPLASGAVEAQRVVDYCLSKGVQLMEGFMWPHHPRTDRLRQLLDSGEIGEIRHIVSDFCFNLGDDSANIRYKTNLAGGSVMDVGCYPVYASRWAFQSEPLRVFAVAQWKHAVDVHMTGLLEYSEGRTATFDCGFNSPFRGSLRVYGSRGQVHVDNMWVPQGKTGFEVHTEGSPAQTVEVEDTDQIVHMIENFSAAILKGDDITPGPQEAVKTLKVLDALRMSAREGRVIEMGDS